MVDLAVKTANFLSASKHSLLLLNGPLAVIQRKSPSENVFEADQKDDVPLYCNLLASKGSMQKFNEPVRIAPCGSLTESGRLLAVCLAYCCLFYRSVFLIRTKSCMREIESDRIKKVGRQKVRDKPGFIRCRGESVHE